MKNIKLLAILSLFVIVGCGDDVPTDYKPENFIEALLLVDEPIQNIIVMRSQPLYHKFDYFKALIPDAEVIIRGDGREFLLSYSTDSTRPGYYYEDANYLIKPNTEYSIEVRLKDGSQITSSTTTPTPNQWLRRPKSFIQYPLDSLRLPASDTVSWSRVPGYDIYLIAVRCMDTLEYGKYLNPPTAELNRRVYRPYLPDRAYNEISQTAFIPAFHPDFVQTPVIWTSFKWFGLHEVVIYVPDWNFTRWTLQNMSSSAINPLLGSVEGGIGVFGSAYALRDTAVLLKNQP